MVEQANNDQLVIQQMTTDYGNNISVRDQVIARLKVQNALLNQQNEQLKQQLHEIEAKSSTSTKKAGK